jgi:hypothetical protein
VLVVLPKDPPPTCKSLTRGSDEGGEKAVISKASTSSDVGRADPSAKLRTTSRLLAGSGLVVVEVLVQSTVANTVSKLVEKKSAKNVFKKSQVT